MISNLDNQIYAKSFNLFLKSTNEKEVILEYLLQSIKGSDVNGILDIGAGLGSFSSHFIKQGKLVTAIEPNELLANNLRSQGFRVINDSWEQVSMSEKFDLIIAAYVVTHFRKDKIDILLEKMMDRLNDGGTLFLLSVHPTKGSWRELHTYFYNLIDHTHRSSSIDLVSCLKKYPKMQEATLYTSVFANTPEEMLDVVEFDFHRFEPKFSQKRKALIQYLISHCVKDHKVVLDMVHQVFIIKK